MTQEDELDLHLSHKLASQLDLDLWAEEMKYDERNYLTEQEDNNE